MTANTTRRMPPQKRVGPEEMERRGARRRATRPRPSLGWQNSAGCRDADSELFFPLSYGSEHAEQIAEAKSYCAVCPVRAECLDYAVATDQKYGIWGGEEPEVRKSLRRREQRRARAA